MHKSASSSSSSSTEDCVPPGKKSRREQIRTVPALQEGNPPGVVPHVDMGEARPNLLHLSQDPVVLVLTVLREHEGWGGSRVT